MAKVEVLVPVFSATVHLGIGVAVEGFQLLSGEFRYSAAFVSKLLGYADNYLVRLVKKLQTTKKKPKKLQALLDRGFTGDIIRVRANRLTRGSTRAYALSFDDFCIWVEYEAFELKTTKAQSLLSASFREILRGRTQEAFQEVTGKAPDPIEKRIVRFQADCDRFLEREALRKEDYEDIANLELFGDRSTLDDIVYQNYAEIFLHLNNEG